MTSPFLSVLNSYLCGYAANVALGFATALLIQSIVVPILSIETTMDGDGVNHRPLIYRRYIRSGSR